MAIWLKLLASLATLGQALLQALAIRQARQAGADAANLEQSEADAEAARTAIHARDDARDLGVRAPDRVRDDDGFKRSLGG